MIKILCMGERARILDDIALFEENAKKFKGSRSAKKAKLVDLAERYCADAKFYLEKGELTTAFGCINYAHGIIDALEALK